MKKYFICMILIFSVAALTETYKVNLTIDPDFPDVRIASVSVPAPAGFFLESFTSEIDGEIEIRLSYGPKLPLEVKKGETYTIKGHVNAEFGIVILNFAILKCKDVKSPGDYNIGSFSGTKKKWPNVKMSDIFSKNTSFPEDWVGVYKGKLVRNTKDGVIGTHLMELHIKATSDPNRFTWKVIYDNQPRNYELIVIDKRRGIYNVDEKNSIVLSSFFVNDTLFSHFGAQFGYLLASYKLKNNQILFNITTSNIEPYQTTGGQGQIPLVHSFEVREQQTAILQKQNK